MLIRSLLGFCGSEGVLVLEDDAELYALYPSANGLYSWREERIILRITLSADGRVKTLTCELAHHLLHHSFTTSEEDRPTLEVEAEGTAYAVLSYFGVDASEYSFAYVARWAKSWQTLVLLGIWSANFRRLTSLHVASAPLPR